MDGVVATGSSCKYTYPGGCYAAAYEPDVAKRLHEANPGSVTISATTGAGTDLFLQTLGDRLRALAVVYELAVRYTWIDAILNGRKRRVGPPPLPVEK